MDIDLNSTDISRFNDKLCSLEVETGSCGTPMDKAVFDYTWGAN
jgi:hypothetical protein